VHHRNNDGRHYSFNSRRSQPGKLIAPCVGKAIGGSILFRA
jgi:hypothetical protein